MKVKVENTLAYYIKELITVVKSFMTQAPDDFNVGDLKLIYKKLFLSSSVSHSRNKLEHLSQQLFS